MSKDLLSTAINIGAIGLGTFCVGTALAYHYNFRLSISPHTVTKTKTTANFGDDWKRRTWLIAITTGPATTQEVEMDMHHFASWGDDWPEDWHGSCMDCMGHDTVPSPVKTHESAGWKKV